MNGKKYVLANAVGLATLSVGVPALAGNDILVDVYDPSSPTREVKHHHVAKAVSSYWFNAVFPAIGINDKAAALNMSPQKQRRWYVTFNIYNSGTDYQFKFNNQSLRASFHGVPDYVFEGEGYAVLGISGRW